MPYMEEKKAREMPHWNSSWKTIYLDAYQLRKDEKCLKCGHSYGERVMHYPCYWIETNSERSHKGGKNMPLDNSAFEALSGTPKGGFGRDENSLTQRILRTIPGDGTAYTAEELTTMGDVKGEDLKRVKTVCNNMTRASSKKASPKLEKKYDENGTAYYRINTAEAPVEEEAPAEEAKSEEDVDAEDE